MAEKYIKVCGKLVTVTEEVYYAYHHMGRQRRTQAEKDERRRVASYDALDTNDGLGVDLLVDEESPGVEDAVIARIMSEKLHRYLALLPDRERSLLEKIYFEEMSERQVAQTLGIPCMTVHNRKVRALRKLRKMMAK